MAGMIWGYITIESETINRAKTMARVFFRERKWRATILELRRLPDEEPRKYRIKFRRSP